jgi:hypothetical protein
MPSARCCYVALLAALAFPKLFCSSGTQAILSVLLLGLVVFFKSDFGNLPWLWRWWHNASSQKIVKEPVLTT